MVKTFNYKLNILGIVSASGLLILGTLLLAPAIPNSAHATCADGDTSEGCATSMASMDTEVTVGTSIAIAMDSKVTMDITPSSVGSVSAVSSKVQVATNSIDGYALFMKADPELVNTSTVNDGAAVNSITNTSTTDTLSNMAENTYGYSISASRPSDTELMNSTYQPLDTTGTTPIRQTTSTGIGTSNTDYGYGDEYYLNLGVKVGTNLPAGTYAGTVTLSAVANPVTVRSMAGLTYMQDMTSEICANTIEHYTKRLTDTRDGKEYWVAKLKDGNCWMTQNLALDLSTEKTLTSADTDLADKTQYQPNLDTIPFGETLSDRFEFSQLQTQSISYGVSNILRAVPNHNSANPQCTETFETNELLANCNDVFIDVSSPEWQPSFQAQPGKFRDEQYDLVAVDEQNKTYDAHYLIGNYYTWVTATTKATGEFEAGETASTSLCPHGWRMPNGGYNETTHTPIDSNDLYHLFHVYGYPEASEYTYLADGNFIYTQVLYGTQQDPTKAPFYFTRGGNIMGMSFNEQFKMVANFAAASKNVFLWTSSVDYNDQNNIFEYAIDASNLYPQGGNYRYYNLANIRCIAR